VSKTPSQPANSAWWCAPGSQLLLRWHRERSWSEAPGKNKRPRIEGPDINPPSYSHVFPTKAPKTHVGEKAASSTNGAGKTDIHMQKTEIRSLTFTHFVLISIQSLNVRLKL
jgi:hypothetical protein